MEPLKPKGMRINLKKYIMLVGLPASGKSSWVNDYIFKNQEMGFQVVSSDNIIEEKGFKESLGYKESHLKYIGFAVGEMERTFKKNIKNRVNIIHDQTNLTVKIRKKHLDKVKSYYKFAVVFTLGKEEWRQRFEKRKIKTGKDIPEFIIKKMTQNFEFPTKKEGFDEIINIQY
jgi:heterogeneous nuclear ribonucleoprotein U-like protein 1